jgi:hypothetical protein
MAWGFLDAGPGGLATPTPHSPGAARSIPGMAQVGVTPGIGGSTGFPFVVTP